jgi:hypothetical protein
MPAQPRPSGGQNGLNQYLEKDPRRKLLLALLFLLMSFACIFCSSQTALLLIDRSQILAGMRSKLKADYGANPNLVLAPLDGAIAAEAARDEQQLVLGQPLLSQGIAVAVLPNPIPTPTFTPRAPAAPPPATGTPAVPGSPSPAAPASATIAPGTGTVAPPPATGTPVVPGSPSPTAPASATIAPGTGTATPFAATATATVPAIDTATDTPTATATSTPTPPTVDFALSAYTVNEGGGSAVITVSLSSTYAQTVTVDYASSDITAVAGLDYAAVGGVLSFSPGQTGQTFTVPITDDNITNEFTETARLTLSNPTNAGLGTLNPATLSIVDNDGQPAVQFVSTSYSIVEGDPLGRVDVGVALNAPSSLPVTVSYATADGTATTTGADYTAASGNLTFNPGITGLSFAVSVITDTVVESAETVQLALSNPVSATLGITATATLTIIDDDPPTVTCLITTTQEAMPNIGPFNERIAGLLCGAQMIVPMVPTKTIVADGDFGVSDMVYYEFLQPVAIPPNRCDGQRFVFMDWVVVQVGPSDAGPWYTVFHWGDNVSDTNTNVAGFSADGELNNEEICISELYNGNSPGVSIDVDARAPAGVYTHVRLYVPAGPNPLDGLELDALDALP